MKPRFVPWQLGETAHIAAVIMACARDRARRARAERREPGPAGVGESEGSAEVGLSRSVPPSPTQREVSQHRYW